jgi:hypothetical protein
MNRALRRKITDRWNIITDDQKTDPFVDAVKSRAFYQLEYILAEAGLLSKHRRHQGWTIETEKQPPHAQQLK